MLERQDSITTLASSRAVEMLKSKLQSALIGLSVTTATLNVAGLLLSTVNLSQIEAGYLAPVLVVFGFLQSLIVVTNHLQK